MYIQDDTIAAIATPIGIGGLSVIRISGKEAIDLASKIFKGKKSLSEAKTSTAHFGIIINKEGYHVDEVIATVFRAPHSYTTEDMVEISCHGGMYVTKEVLNTILEAGSRLAQPGEFTKRAFLNGRIDLAQAEAVADVIQSSSTLSHKASMTQLEGFLSDEIKKCRQTLLDLCSLLELELDFVDEGIEIQSLGELNKKIKSVLLSIDNLIDSYSVGKVYREGVRVVIVGKPNVGKSSILNILLNENRAIVTDVPGTTRDIIEENLIIEGILFKVIDTAGVRKTLDPVEVEGVLRTQKQIEIADVIIIVLDHTQRFTSEDKEILNHIENCGNIHKNLLVINKMDIDITDCRFEETVKTLNNLRIYISAKTGMGLPELKISLVDIATQGRVTTGEIGVIITNARHNESLLKARNSLQTAIISIEENMSNEFIALDLRAALYFLGEIIGEITTDDILNNIFSKFCIGK
ncbi:MAG: tRNA uridine-5-carboxymethylaminomethyl(34) synthesis GTPase MnmE [Bacteroidota bacterium]|nr:tRNA uridine-5-carboxymethylaminomethyl(34) synthesis GTPase MnmE [Bacteroidota bacterium]